MHIGACVDHVMVHANAISAIIGLHRLYNHGVVLILELKLRPLCRDIH
jgi:hypothetical protein